MGEGSRPGVGARHEAGAEGPREYLGAGGSAPNPALTTHPYSMKEVIVVIMNVNDFVILPGSKPGTSVRLKAKTVRELQLEKAHLEMENEEMEKKLQQLQSNMNREKEERKTSSAYHWKSGRAGLVTTQARVLSRSKGNNNKVSSGKVKWQILKEQIQEPVKEPLKCEMASAAAHKKSEAKGMAHGPCEIKSALLTEADTRVGKSEVVDHFVKGINLNELKIIQEQKTVNSKHQVTSDKFSSLLVSVGSAEELSSASTCTSTEYHNKGLLLNGTFNEEESAESFQEALLQWRKGNRDHREKLCASGVLSESVGVCEVQTNLTVMKKPIQTEFKKGGLSYMEKLLLKKYRRAPVDQISVSCIKDLRPVLTLSVHQAMTGGGREGDDDDDDDVDDLTVEEVKRYWTSVVRKEVPDTVPESAESSLKIEFLEESYDKDLEESSNLLVTEAGAVGMNKQGKAEPLKQCGRNPVSSKEISQDSDVQEHTELVLLPEKMVVCCCLERNVVQKESIKLQDIAKRQKLVSTWYWGLEGFFVGVNPKRVMLEACSSLCADSIPMDCSISFPGDGRWFIERSLSEYADDTVVQGVLESQLNRPSSSLEAHRRISTLMAVWQSYPGNDSRGPWSTNMPRCKLTGNCPTSTQRKPKSSPLRVNTDIPKHKCNDVTKQDDYFWEYEADQVALLTLEKELQSYTGPEKHYLLTSKDVASSIRDSEKISRNTTDFHKNLKVTDHTGVDTLGGWDDQMEEEEILEDKQQVLALQ
ncbi:zinc finger B-box domain-containing protein 1 isoform X7 [Strigops habroptila]|uniref:zinc finger B-box domain-containing protein 1 isoform X7 n=1 Tax=Strigops habroptila TaxID=2489341 RepID=UPI0011D0102B|nr:zinc finger B-box domain-containing protein 1 isoform X7 [Strigops habroptila]